MFSELGSLFRTTFRQTESNDTRQHIPHEERDTGQRKKNNSQNQNNNNALWEDTMGVSVVALRKFLIDFIQAKPEGKDLDFKEKIAVEANIPKRPAEQKRPTSTQNAKAVRAYQTMASHAPKPDTAPKQEKDNSPQNDALVNQIESQELRDIYQLIQDLEKLSANNISQLRIFPAGSFVESLQNAVRLALSDI